MTRLLTAASFPGRTLVLYLLLAAPLYRLLFQNDYGFFHSEVAVLSAILLVICSVMALAAGRDLLFYALVVVLIVGLSANTVQIEFLPTAQLRWIILGIAAVMGLLLYLLKRTFFVLLVIFVVGGLATDLLQMLFRGASTERRINASAASGRPLEHVLYLIFDEHIGLEGYPQEIRGCQEAKEYLQQVLFHNRFRVYPNAFSNYRSSWDSIPSILNGHLLQYTGYYERASGPRRILYKNAVFGRSVAQGYAVRVYQSDYINYSSPQYSSLTATTYQVNSLAAIHLLNLTWKDRLRQILVVYLQADRFWWDVYTRLMPKQFHFERIRVSPLAVRKVWPEQLLHDIQSAERKTLFFAHLMIPHYPYLYGQEGSIRAPDVRLYSDPLTVYDQAEYVRRYHLYAEQALFVARQLETVLKALAGTGLFDSMTILVHGDHGSRLRWIKESDRAGHEKLARTTPKCPAVSRYDYVSRPELQDLLNRFSTLLAVKLPGAAEAKIVSEKGSVLYFLSGLDHQLFAQSPQPVAGVNSVYLFDENGLPRDIPLLDIWAGE